MQTIHNNTEPKSVAESLKTMLTSVKLNTSEQDAELYMHQVNVAHMHEFIRDAGIPGRHMGVKNLGNAEWLSIFNRIRGQLGKGMLLALLGSRGTGKTQMAVELIRENCREQRTAKYRKAIELFMSIRANYNVGKDEMSALKDFIRPKLLILDEAHERGETAWEDRLLTYVIDKRYDAMLDTILISNSTEDQFFRSVGSSITSRIQESGGVVVCNWKSFRG